MHRREVNAISDFNEGQMYKYMYVHSYYIVRRDIDL